MDSKTFEAITTVDASYYMLRLEHDKLNKLNSIKPIDKEIDISTGYNPYLDIYINIQIILEDMILAKDILQYPFDSDMIMLNQVKEYIKNNSIDNPK